jgi:methylenetetrahydrofolate dehydrogenase (NADP+)/methenyltetrahydrofolate cyclohydrolase
MSAVRLNGTAEADRILRRLQAAVRRTRRPVTLATILVGSRYDSALYVKLKRQAASRVGIATEYHHLPETTSQRQLENIIRKLNRRSAIHGILLQLPLPRHLNADAAIAVMDPTKDVDGFHPANHYIVPPPIAAVKRLIALARPTRQSFAVILAQPSVFSRQLAQSLEHQGVMTVSLAPHRQQRLITAKADIIISALGTGQQLTARDIRAGAILIDVGIRKHGRKAIGDVGTSCWTTAKAISPVPGGVGPLTIAYVLKNTYQLSRKS